MTSSPSGRIPSGSTPAPGRSSVASTGPGTGHLRRAAGNDDIVIAFNCFGTEVLLSPGFLTWSVDPGARILGVGSVGRDAGHGGFPGTTAGHRRRSLLTLEQIEARVHLRVMATPPPPRQETLADLALRDIVPVWHRDQ